MRLFENAPARLFLIADNDAHFCDAVSRSLLNARHAVAIADSIKQVRCYVDVSAPSLILMGEGVASGHGALGLVAELQRHEMRPALALAVTAPVENDTFKRLAVRYLVQKDRDETQWSLLLNKLADWGEEQSNLRGLRVLIVDDEADACELFSNVLSRNGASTRVAFSASEALEQVEAFDPQVLLSDIRMPVEDGYSMLQKIRRRGNMLPAIAVSAFGRSQPAIRIQGEDFQMHLHKPIDPADVVAAVAAFAAHS